MFWLVSLLLELAIVSGIGLLCLSSVPPGQFIVHTLAVELTHAERRASAEAQETIAVAAATAICFFMMSDERFVMVCSASVLFDNQLSHLVSFPSSRTVASCRLLCLQVSYITFKLPRRNGKGICASNSMWGTVPTRFW